MGTDVDSSTGAKVGDPEGGTVGPDKIKDLGTDVVFNTVDEMVTVLKSSVKGLCREFEVFATEGKTEIAEDGIDLLRGIQFVSEDSVARLEAVVYGTWDGQLDFVKELLRRCDGDEDIKLSKAEVKRMQDLNFKPFAFDMNTARYFDGRISLLTDEDGIATVIYYKLNEEGEVVGFRVEN